MSHLGEGFEKNEASSKLAFLRNCSRLTVAQLVDHPVRRNSADVGSNPGIGWKEKSICEAAEVIFTTSFEPVANSTAALFLSLGLTNFFPNNFCI